MAFQGEGIVPCPGRRIYSSGARVKVKCCALWLCKSFPRKWTNAWWDSNASLHLKFNKYNNTNSEQKKIKKCWLVSLCCLKTSAKGFRVTVSEQSGPHCGLWLQSRRAHAKEPLLWMNALLLLTWNSLINFYQRALHFKIFHWVPKTM